MEENAIVTVTFSIDAYPDVTETPTLERMDGGPISLTANISANSVTLSDLQREDAGNYSFVVSTNGAVGRGNFEIIVLCELTWVQRPFVF